MQHIKEFVEKFLKKSHIGEQREEDFIFTNWANIVGRDLAENTGPYKFLDGKLYLYVENSVMMNELTYRKKDIKILLNNIFREEKIKDIVLKIKQ